MTIDPVPSHAGRQACTPTVDSSVHLRRTASDPSTRHGPEPIHRPERLDQDHRARPGGAAAGPRGGDGGRVALAWSGADHQEIHPLVAGHRERILGAAAQVHGESCADERLRHPVPVRASREDENRAQSGAGYLGAGGHLVWTEPAHDAVVVVRWMDPAHTEGFMRRMSEALAQG